ncbi:hypothetical protein CEXT_176491 [Caerostris extrusa]|uniref:Uncharacterized protein n=1 Tax=Caerostris extrusa TaxID=172846 RepID=A0AAV4UAD3_CAEEX|nr:hypothetical protein CEXT_176491 [Caerostris extrusa]
MYSNSKRYTGIQKVSNAQIKTPESGGISQSKNQEMYSKRNPYTKSQIFNIPIQNQDTEIISLPQNMVNGEEGKSGFQNVKQYSETPKKILENEFALGKPIVLRKKNIDFNATNSQIFSPRQQFAVNNVINNFSKLNKSVIRPETRKSLPFPLSKSLISSPMSTIFDTSDDKGGQYYHYVMKVGHNSGNNMPSGIKMSPTRNLF